MWYLLANCNMCGKTDAGACASPEIDLALVRPRAVVMGASLDGMAGEALNPFEAFGSIGSGLGGGQALASGLSAPGRIDRVRMLREREEALNERKRRIAEAQQFGEVGLAPNYPPFYPLIFVGSWDEFGFGARAALEMSVRGVAVLVIAVAFNFLTVLLLHGLPGYRKARCLILACVWGMGLVWYAVRYSHTRLLAGCRGHDVGLGWGIFHCGLIAGCGYLTLGLPRSGSVGMATLLDLVAQGRSSFCTCMGLVNTLLMGTVTVLEVMVLRRGQGLARGYGAAAAADDARLVQP